MEEKSSGSVNSLNSEKEDEGLGEASSSESASPMPEDKEQQQQQQQQQQPDEAVLIRSKAPPLISPADERMPSRISLQMIKKMWSMYFSCHLYTVYVRNNQSEIYLYLH